MRTAGRWLLESWLLAVLVLLGMEGRLPELDRLLIRPARWARPTPAPRQTAQT
jgi:hypothetical protein